MDLVLEPSCGGCGTAEELYGTTCKHMTLCVSCGKTMAENGGSCYDCGTPVTRLIREVILVKEENGSTAAIKKNVNSESGTPQTSQTSSKSDSSPSPVQATGPVTEDEIRAVLSPKTQVTALDLVSTFKSRLKTREDKDAFVEILNKISKLQTVDGKKIVVLRENNSTAIKNNGSSPSPVQAIGPVTEDEIRAVLSPKTQVTTRDLVAKFKSRLETREDKDAFAVLLKKISKIQTVNGKKIIVLRENAVAQEEDGID